MPQFQRASSVVPPSGNAASRFTRLGAAVLAGTVALFAPASGLPAAPSVHAAAAAAKITYKLEQRSETIVTSGVREFAYAWIPSDKTKTTEMLHVLQIDLSNKYVELGAMAGRQGSVTSGQSVGAMVKETGAIAGVNGDVYNTGNEGAPLGAQINAGQLLVSPAQLQGMYAFGVTADRKPVIDSYTFTGTVIAADGSAFALSGINKSAYRTEPNNGYSHVDALYLYTSAWTAPERPSASGTTPVEALVVDGVVTAVGKPLSGAIPANGYIVRGHLNRASGKFIETSLTVGSTVAAAYTLQSNTTGKTVDPASFRMMVGGHTLLVDGGVAVPFTRNVAGVSGSADRARTAAGYSKDGRYAYLLAVEETGGRVGVSLQAMQEMLVQLGIWKAVNLDGGSSTTMITRPLGEFQTQLAFPTYYGGTTQRQVANGIGVYTSAPAGTLKGISASGPRTLFIGQQATYALKAYDSYYNPLDPLGLQPLWSLSSPIGTFAGGALTATAAGTATLSVSTSGSSAKADVPLEVIGEAQVAKLTVEPSSIELKAGAKIRLPVKAQLTDGRELAVPAASVQWELRGFTGSVDGAGVLTIDKVNGAAPAGYAIARYDGYGAMAVLTPGIEQTVANFEQVYYNVGFTGTPAETTGTAAIVDDVTGHGTKVLLMTYDMTVGSGKRFANAVINDGTGLSLSGGASVLTLDVLGDQSMNWLRAEFVDAGGKPAYVTLADKIDWSGWKTLRVDLAAAGLQTPAQLTKLYIVNLETGQDERALIGELGFDNLVVQYPSKPFETPHPTVVMTLGNTKATIDGTPATLPGAPFVQKGTNTTYLPLRFVADALGAQVGWDNVRKRVTVLRGDTMLELWVGSGGMTANGERIPLATAPVIIKGSVYVPVRVISEQLGHTVGWSSKTKTITIH